MTHSGGIQVDQPSDAAIATEGGDKAQEPVEGEAGDGVGDGDGDGDGDEHGAGGGTNIYLIHVTQGILTIFCR